MPGVTNLTVPAEMVLVDQTARQAENDGLFVRRIEDSLFFKRALRLADGFIEVSSDNPSPITPSESATRNR